MESPKVQCKMALIKEGLWSIVDETETAPVDEGALAKFVGRKKEQSPCDNCIVNGPGFVICGWC